MFPAAALAACEKHYEESMVLKQFILTLLMSAALAAPATASTITFDLGNAGPGGPTFTSSAVNGAGIFMGSGPVVFTNSGVSISATGFGGTPSCSGTCLNSTYVSQKPGSFGPGETGIGESDNQATQSDSDREVTASTFIVLDNTNAIAHGYLSSQLVIESLQDGEGARIYGLNTMGATLDLTGLTSGNLLATLIGCSAPGCTGGVTQFVTLPTWNYFVLTGIPNNANGSGSNDFVLSEDIFTKSNNSNVPEPLTVALFGAGLLGLGGLRRRKAAG
jgi:PEP-CTERM motif